MLGRQERHDAIARHICADIRHQMPEVVFLLVPTALSVRKTHVPFRLSRWTAWYVSIHASMPSRRQFGARRPELRGNNARRTTEGLDEGRRHRATEPSLGRPVVVFSMTTFLPSEGLERVSLADGPQSGSQPALIV